jgi:hypothetical protein
MSAQTEINEYLDEIRQEVCSRCVERPPGGPPCAPLGKPCGIELHLPRLIAAIHEVHSELIEPYLVNNRLRICEHCTFRRSSACPCPMDTLAVLLVEAVEAVDERRERRAKGRRLLSALPYTGQAGLEECCAAYEEAAGTWVGCDWGTYFGATGLDLAGRTAAEAEALAVEAIGLDDGEVWAAAARWLGDVERSAREAEAQAALALAAANAGEWTEARKHARRAWALEFETGRPLRHSPPTWQRFYQTIEAAANAHAENLPAAAK